MTNIAVALSPDGFAELKSFIDGLDFGVEIASRRAVLIETLHKAQSIFGYLPEEVQRVIAENLDLHLSEVYGVVSFYHYFTTELRGQNQINFCLGTACFVRGAENVIKEFEEELGVKMGETTPDGLFTLGTLRCVGACSLAPVVMINDKTYGRVRPDQVTEILAEYRD
jgi:NADH-quinone oxidoreductase subunit E